MLVTVMKGPKTFTREDVVEKAKSVKLDTVYFLGGLKGENA